MNSLLTNMYISVVIKNNNVLSNGFKQAFFPIFFDIGKIIFWCAVFYGVYFIIRRQTHEGVDRLKWAGIGYICLRFVDVFTSIVDKTADAMVKNMGS